MTRLLRIAAITIAGFAFLVAIFLFLLIMGGESEASLGEAPTGRAQITTAVAVEVSHGLGLTVGSPQAGEIVTNPLAIEGKSTANQVGYRLFGAGLPLAEGTIVPLATAGSPRRWSPPTPAVSR